MNKINKAINLIEEHCPPSEAHSKKQILPHCTRVGAYLRENNYPETIVLAGYLHDLIEWSDIDPQIISDQFSPRVLEIIKANSKDHSIKDKDERIKDLVQRCAKLGEDALIVKAADTLDSFKHYTQTQNQPELEYCAKNAKAVLQYKTNDKIFNELNLWASNNMDNTTYRGTIIEESLENKDVLNDIKIIKTRVSKATTEDKTPWLKQWTLHTVEVSESQAADIAEKLSTSLDSKHDWYADFKNSSSHYIIFRNKIFKIKRSKEEYDEVTKYGISLGIPDYQLDFSAEIK